MPKIDLITGFLGSGKTTFILKYARQLMSQGKKLGILEYDYGAINSDIALLSELRSPLCELEMVAAACDADCLARRFKSKLIGMAMMGYDRIILEPSGVFDMDMFFDTLREPPLENWYEIGNVITVVDSCLSADLSAGEKFILASQAACAGNIILSKTQHATAEDISSAKAIIEDAVASINCRNFIPKYAEKPWDDLTADDFEKISSCGCKFASYTKLPLAQSEFSSVSFLNIDCTLDELSVKARTLLNDSSFGDVLRVKGFILSGEQMYQLNATKADFLIEPIDFNQQVLTVIGRNLNELKIREYTEK